MRHGSRGPQLLPPATIPLSVLASRQSGELFCQPDFRHPSSDDCSPSSGAYFFPATCEGAPHDVSHRLGAVLALSRKLITPGYDPANPLEAWRGFWHHCDKSRDTEDVRLSRQTGSDRRTDKVTRMTRNGHSSHCLLSAAHLRRRSRTPHDTTGRQERSVR
jgi:hypothetical protein